MSGNVAVLPNGRVAVGREDGSIDIWGPLSRSRVGRLMGHSAQVYALAVLPDGRLVSGSEDMTVRVWSVGRRVELACWNGHEGGVVALCVLPDGRLASSASDRSIRLWDTRLGKVERSLERYCHHEDCAVAWLPGGVIAGSTETSGLLQWDTSSGRLLAAFEIPTYIGAMATLPQGRLVVGDCMDVQLFDPKRQRLSDRLYGHRCGVHHILAASNRTIISAGSKMEADGSFSKDIVVWDIFKRSGTRFGVGNHRTSGLGVLQDGRIVAADAAGQLIWLDRREGTIVERQQRWLEFGDGL